MRTEEDRDLAEWLSKDYVALCSVCYNRLKNEFHNKLKDEIIYN